MSEAPLPPAKAAKSSADAEHAVEKTSAVRIIRFAGAFVAFIIGSGYATGQEVLQFFSSYGYGGIAGTVIALVLFVWAGKVFMEYGYRHRNEALEGATTQAFIHYTGKMLGTFLQWFIPVFLFFVVVVMVSGSGATLNQFFGTPQWMGTAAMVVLILLSSFAGLRRIVDVISYLGPLTILFTVLISVYALVKNPHGLAHVGAHVDLLESLPHAAAGGVGLWALAGLLYVAYNVTGSIPFFTETGKMARTKAEARGGAILGGVLLMLAALLLVLAHLAYLPQLAELPVPNLFLSDLIHPVASTLFMICILGEIYSTAAPMLWISATRVAPEGTKINRLAIVVLSVITLFGSQLPFDVLVGTVYPYTGYLGILVLVLVAVREVRSALARARS